ncbi:peptidoglycan-binding protein [Evansella clarkii]|uniref:C40 family peptidase n=1 Tax=Evansella clarkii TaxID=79879 RepID=UPI00099860F6|nr:peptidoglycan-binding protein [Evansella clarkii]
MKKTVLSVVLAGTLLALPEVTDAALGDQTLREGMRHSDVVELQEALREKGHFTFHTSTGFFGSITADAVRSFQRSAGITVDGIVGPQTVGALGAGSSTSKVQTSSQNSSSASDFSRTLRVGDRGNDVVSLQEALREKGHFTFHTSTGYYGSITADAVRSFQRSAGISVDGIAGPQTFGALRGSGGNAQTSSRTTSISSGQASSSRSYDVEKLIRDARNLLGTPYVWGGTTPSGMDSSGFITYVFRQNGVSLPRTHSQYYPLGTTVQTPQRGDVVFFETYKAGPSHAGIYLGDGTFIHNSSSQGVTITRMDNSYWSPRYIGAKRY